MSDSSSARLIVDTTKTLSSTSSKTGAARKGPRVRTTPSVLQLAASQWAVMDGEERNTYAVLAKQMATLVEPTASTRNGAYGLFVKLAAASIATGQDIPPSALPYTVAPKLPAVQVVATYVNKKLTLTLLPSAPYPHPIALKAPRPILAANDTYKSASFKKIGSIPALNGPLDITALYESRYFVPGLGYKIGIEMIGVAPGGYHTATVFAFGIVSSTAAAATLADPDQSDTLLKAA